MKQSKNQYLKGKAIISKPIPKNISIKPLVDEYFESYNAGRLREAAHLLTEKMLTDYTTIGMSLTGALTPAGLGRARIVPLIKAGFVDWIVSSGAPPSEAVTWGKIDPNILQNAVVAYVDSEIALPVLTSYVLACVKLRPIKKLYN